MEAKEILECALETSFRMGMEANGTIKSLSNGLCDNAKSINALAEKYKALAESAEASRIERKIPEYTPNTKEDYDKLRQYIKKYPEMFKGVTLGSENPTISVENITTLPQSAMDYRQGTYIEGFLKKDADGGVCSFCGIVKECCDQWITMYAFIIMKGDTFSLRVDCGEYSKPTILFHDGVNSVAASSKGCLLYRSDISKMKTATGYNSNKLNDVLSCYGFKFNGNKILNNQWQDRTIDIT